ncbi:MAG: hypothetical protein ACFFEY_17035 [Candidatus Thorarchaeota archaeon]
MILQTIGFLEALADIIGVILTFLMPILTPIGVWIVDVVTVIIGFLKQTLGGEMMLFIVICVVLVVLGIIINIIWPGDVQGTIFSKGLDKIEDLEDRMGKMEDSIIDSVRRCKDCGNPIGDADICSLCGARN